MITSTSRGHRPRRHIGLVLTVLAAAALAACGTSTEPVDPTRPTPTQVPEIGTAAADELCDMMRAEIGNWQQQGPAIARVSYNGTVHSWALRNGAINTAITLNRGAIDTVTIERCPDVRDQVLAALDISDLASGLAGF